MSKVAIEIGSKWVKTMGSPFMWIDLGGEVIIQLRKVPSKQ
jgi:hypothetical protein